MRILPVVRGRVPGRCGDGCHPAPAQPHPVTPQRAASLCHPAASSAVGTFCSCSRPATLTKEIRMLRIPARMSRIARRAEGQYYTHKVRRFWNDLGTLLGARARSSFDPCLYPPDVLPLRLSDQLWCSDSRPRQPLARLRDDNDGRRGYGVTTVETWLRADTSLRAYGLAAHPFTSVHCGSSGGRFRRPSTLFTRTRSVLHTCRSSPS